MQKKCASLFSIFYSFYSYYSAYNPYSFYPLIFYPVFLQQLF